MATCADILHAELPDSAAPDSYSLLPDLSGRARAPVRPAIVYGSIDGNFSIQQGKWKLEFCPGSGGWAAPRNRKAYQEGLPAVQLYDMQVDAGERMNVESGHPAEVQRLTSLMEAYIKNGRSTPGKPLANDVPVDLLKNGYTVPMQKKR
jgi:hypothetical protein